MNHDSVNGTELQPGHQVTGPSDSLPLTVNSIHEMQAHARDQFSLVELDGDVHRSGQYAAGESRFHCKVCGLTYSWREVTLAWFGWACVSCLEEVLTTGG
jgi:hypothetical protein